MQNLEVGFSLMMTGMGTVFSFLVILWISVSVMGNIIQKLNEIFPEQSEAVKIAVKNTTNDAEIAIAIASAKMLSK